MPCQSNNNNSLTTNINLYDTSPNIADQGVLRTKEFQVSDTGILLFNPNIDPFDRTTDSDSSSEISSDSIAISEEDLYPLAVIIPLPRQLRIPVYFYPIRNREGRDFVFGFNTRINTTQSDNYFNGLLPFSRNNLDHIICSAFRARGTRNVKLEILRGRHINQPAVILKSYCQRSFVHKVLLGDGSTIYIQQRHVRLLDPHFFLPFGFPVYRN